MNKQKLFISFWILFLIITTGFWITKNNLPPAWDQANYITATEIMYQSLTRGSYLDFLEKTLTTISRKAPLLTYLPLPLFILFGSSLKIALVVNIIFLILFAVFFYLLVKKILNKEVALIALLVTTTAPLFYGLQRQFLVEYGLTVLIIIWLYLLPKTDKFKNTKYTILLGVVSGLGMLMKLHFFILVGGGFLYYIYINYGFRIFQLWLVKRMLYLFIPAIIIMLPWYSKNLLTVLWHAKRATNPEVLGNYYYGNPFSPYTIYLTLMDFINYVISPYYAFLLLLLVIIVCLKKVKVKPNFYLLSVFIPSFLIFFFGPNKDYRFMVTFIPFIAIFIAVLYLKVAGNIALRLLPFILIFPILTYLHTTIIDINLLNNLRLGNIIISDKKIGRYVEQAKPDYWPNKEILKSVAQLEPSNRTKVITLASENEELNINNLIYYQTKEKLPLKLKTASYYPKTTSLDTILNDIRQSDYLLIKIGGTEGPSDINRFNYQVIKKIENIEPSNKFELPDGGVLYVYQTKNI